LYHSGALYTIVIIILIRVPEPPKEFDQDFDSYYTGTADGVGGTVIQTPLIIFYVRNTNEIY
jgi:hypothetical protein